MWLFFDELPSDFIFFQSVLCTIVQYDGVNNSMILQQQHTIPSAALPFMVPQQQQQQHHHPSVASASETAAGGGGGIGLGDYLSLGKS